MKSEEEVKKMFDSRLRILNTLKQAKDESPDGVLVVVHLLCEAEIRLLADILQVALPETVKKVIEV